MAKKAIKQHFVSDLDETLVDIREGHKEEVEVMLEKFGVISNFTCWHQLWVILGAKKNNKLYFVDLDGKKRLLLHRKREFEEIRILFERGQKDELLIKEIKKLFPKVKYIAYNLLLERLGWKSEALREDLILDVKTVSCLRDNKVRNHYRVFTRRHPNLVFLPADLSHKEKIFEFLDKWGEVVGKKSGQEMKCENDRRFLDMYLEKKEFWGGVVFDADRIVGICFWTYHPSNRDNLAVGLIMKNLRGYRSFGQWLEIMECRQALWQGFKKLLIGGTEVESQANFKRQFLLKGEIKKYYSYEIWKDKKVVVGENFLRDIWT